MKLRILVLLLSMFLLSESVSAQNKNSYKIIVNDANEKSSIRIGELSKIFLKKVTLWEDNTKIQPVDLKGKSKVRINFSKEVHGKGVDAIKAYWQKQIFSGRGVPPPEKNSDREVITYVKNNLGAIGYISKKADTTDVKVIEVID